MCAFRKEFGNLTLEVADMPKRGTCLKATCGDTYILMDICGMNPMLVPDGTNAYFFANKLIFVTRWSDMSDAEKTSVEQDDLCLLIHPYRFVQFSLKVGDNWGDVMVNLYHCLSGWNDENEPVDEAIFVFCDTHDADYVTCRSVDLSAFRLNIFLKQANVYAYDSLGLPLVFDGDWGRLNRQANNDRSRDVYDYLYDYLYEKTRGVSREARSKDPSSVPGGIYVEINGKNEIVNAYQQDMADGG